MKKILCLIALFGTLTNSQAACSFQTSTTDGVKKVINEHGGWPISDEQCSILNNHNLALSVSGEATVLSNASIAWSVVHLIDRDRNMTSNASSINTIVNTKAASMNVASDLLFESITSSIKGLDFIKAMKEVENFRSKNLGTRKQ